MLTPGGLWASPPRMGSVSGCTETLWLRPVLLRRLCLVQSVAMRFPHPNCPQGNGGNPHSPYLHPRLWLSARATGPQNIQLC